MYKSDLDQAQARFALVSASEINDIRQAMS